MTLQRDGQPYLLKLYVTEITSALRDAIAMLESICRQELGGRYALRVIDVREHPEMAESDRILATPTLSKELPPPLRRIIGDLTDRDRTLIGLALGPEDPTETP